MLDLGAEFEIDNRVLGIRWRVQNPSDPRELENAYYQMTKQLIAAAIPKDIVP